MYLVHTSKNIYSEFNKQEFLGLQWKNLFQTLLMGDQFELVLNKHGLNLASPSAITHEKVSNLHHIFVSLGADRGPFP